MIKMNINNRDFHSIPFVVIPTRESADASEEYILGYIGDQLDTLVEGGKENGSKVKIEKEDNENKLLLKCIIDDYMNDENDDVKKDLITKEKRYHIDDKKIISHLLSESPEENKELEDNPSIKKEIDDITNNETFLVNLVPELPSENNFQDLQKEVSSPIKKKMKKEVCNSQGNPEGIKLVKIKKEVCNSQGRPEVIKFVKTEKEVCNSQGSPKLIKSVKTQKEVCNSQGSPELSKLVKTQKEVCNSQGSPEVILLDDDSMDTGGNGADLETEGLELFVSSSSNSPVALQMDNACDRVPAEEPITCGRVTRHNIAKQKMKKEVCNSQGKPEGIKLVKIKKEVCNSQGSPEVIKFVKTGKEVCNSQGSPELIKSVKTKKEVCNSQGSPELSKLVKTQKEVCNSQGSPEVILLDDDSMDTGGNGADLETEGLELFVSSSSNSPVALQMDNACDRVPAEEPITCGRVTRHNIAKQKTVKDVSNSQDSPEVIQLDCDSMDLEENRTASECQKVPAPKQLSVDSYCRMITRAILSSPGGCISLKKLFEFISLHYPNHANRPEGWQAPIEKYLCHSKHFVKALPKDFVEGSTEMWILNPATERKMIARYIRGSSEKKQMDLNYYLQHCFPCPGGCGLRFKRKAHLKRHHLTIHGRNCLICKICGKKLSRMDTLKLHMQNIHGSDATSSRQRNQHQHSL